MASVNKVCPECGGEFVRTVKQINEVIRRSGKWTCKPCAMVKTNKARSKEIGSTRIHNRTGYVLEKTELGWERQHVLVIERSIGRKLVGDEVVHHINGSKTDNALENLMLMTHGEHSALHNSQRNNHGLCK